MADRDGRRVTRHGSLLQETEFLLDVDAGVARARHRRFAIRDSA